MTEKRKSMVGRVTSNKMDKTAVVAVETFKRHPLYRKAIRVSRKYLARFSEVSPASVLINRRISRQTD